MARLSNAVAQVVVDGTAVREYIDPDDINRADPHKTSCYIQVQSNARFTIFIHVPATHALFDSSSNLALHVRVFKDGRNIMEKVFHPREQFQVVDYIEGGCETDPEFVFPYVVQDTNISRPGDAHLWEDSSISVDFRPARLIVGPRTDTFGNDLGGIIEVWEDENSDDFLQIIFKYRPFAVLQTILHPRLSIPTLPHSPSAQHPADVAWHQQTASNDDGNELYCTCRLQRPHEQFVTCDNDDCAIKTYHLDCVGMVRQPTGTMWLCPKCEELPAEDIKLEGRTDTYGAFLPRWIGQEGRTWI